MSSPPLAAAAPRRKPYAKLAVAVLAAAGLMVAIWLIADAGFAEVGGAFAKIGWGLAGIALYDVSGLCFAGLAWHSLVAGSWFGRQAPLYIWFRWLREAINTLLPVAQVGGDLIGARLIARHSLPLSTAIASVIADKTVETIGQLIFTIAGVLFLLGRSGDAQLASGFGIGLLVAGPMLLLFLGLQNSRAFAAVERLLLALAERLQWGGLEQVAGLHAALVAFYRQPVALTASFVFHMFAWVAGAGQIWLALRFMGHPIAFTDAFILESLGQAARSAAFLIPGGLGAQEGALLLIGGALGLPADYALALSLVKRSSQLIFGLPMLATWPFLETRRAH